MKETKFKDTELGKIPEEWEVCNLGSIGVPLMCKRIMKWQTNETAGIPFYKIGTFGKQADAFIAPDIWRYMITHFNYPKKGDILISAAGTIGRTVVFDGQPSYFQDSNIVWIDNDEEKVLNPYLEYAYTKIAWSTDASTISRLYNNNLKSALILFPHDKAEQQRIASALSDADALVAELDALIEKKRAIMAGTMQELLTGKRRLQGFSGERKETSLSYFGNVTMGQSPSSLFYNDTKDGLPLIQGNADMCNRKSIIRNYTSKITKTCNAGDIIMSVRAPVGAVGIASFDSCIGRGVCAFKRNNFLYYLLLFIEDDWSKLSAGSTFESVNGNHIRNFEVTIPSSLAEQRAIASILSDMDAEIAELEAKRDKYKEVRQGMMQQLLTGKIRLI